jgi:hypothetical protein
MERKNHNGNFGHVCFRCAGIISRDRSYQRRSATDVRYWFVIFENGTTCPHLIWRRESEIEAREASFEELQRTHDVFLG